MAVVKGISVVPVLAIILCQREELTGQPTGAVSIAAFERSRCNPSEAQQPRVTNAQASGQCSRNRGRRVQRSHHPGKDSHPPAQTLVFGAQPCTLTSDLA